MFTLPHVVPCTDALRTTVSIQRSGAEPQSCTKLLQFQICGHVPVLSYDSSCTALLCSFYRFANITSRLNRQPQLLQNMKLARRQTALNLAPPPTIYSISHVADFWNGADDYLLREHPVGASTAPASPCPYSEAARRPPCTFCSTPRSPSNSSYLSPEATR